MTHLGELRRALLRPEVPVVVALYLLLRWLGWVWPVQWWIFPVFVVVAAVVGTSAMVLLGGREVSGRRLWLRTAALVLPITPVMYVTGWGPMLAVGYVFPLIEIGEGAGSAAARPVLWCSLLGMALGQLAIELDVAPTFVDPPEVHGLAALAAAGLVVTVNVVAAVMRSQEAAEVELRRSEERFRALVRHATDVIMVVGRDGIVRYVSPAAERELGRSIDELVGVPAAELVHPADTHALGPFFEAMQHSNASDVHAAELRMGDGDSWQWYEVGATNRVHDPSVGGFVAILHNVTERRRFQEELSHRAFHDDLTGLPNRSGFLVQLREAIDAAPPDRRVGVLFLDVDRFKLVNDNLGHETGDRLLVEYAARLRQSVRPGDVVARFGGDEFTVLVPGIRDAADAETVAQRVIDALRDPIWLGDREIVASGSVGIAVSGLGGADADDLVRDADLAMYTAKERGRARVEVFDDRVAMAAVGRLELEADLWRAVDEGGLEVHFQPEVCLDDGRIVALEALVRWPHPTRGMLHPPAFVPFAEESSLILAVDRFVLREACRRGAQWRDHGGDLRINVNLSARFLRQHDAVSDIELALAGASLPPGALQIEITERTALEDDEVTRASLRNLRDLGVHVAIDDFGTGYSALGYLKQLPVDVLKLDRTFVQGVASERADEAIAGAVISLGHALGMRVTAEGVERAEQASHLRSLGCDTAQGYHYAAAEPPDRVRELLGHGVHESDGAVTPFVPGSGTA